jgi:hypothetical protein
VLFFAAIGAGYLLVEIPLIQQMGLVFDQSAIALAATLFILLLSSGIGSLFSTRVHLGIGLFGLIAIILLLAIITLPAVEFVHPLPFIWRIVVASLLIIPLGFLMGMPFVSGLRRITKIDPEDVPWVWAINGAASGIFGVIAAMITLGSGFGLTLLTGASAYFIALLAIPPDSPEGPELV